MIGTLSLKQVNIMRRLLIVILMLAAFAVACSILVKPVHAGTLEGSYAPESEFSNVTNPQAEFEPTTFYLYKVGHFDEDGQLAVWDAPYDQYATMALDATKYDNPNWTKDWLECASTLSNYIPADAEKTSVNVDKNGHFTANLPSGVYLLKGDSQAVKNPADGEDAYWWPQPMLVCMKGDSVQINVKPVSEKVSKLKVKKVWDWNKDKRNLNKKGVIDLPFVTVNVYYRNEDGTESLKFTEKLNEENQWSFEWSTEGKGDPSRWRVEEVVDGSDGNEILKDFKVIIGEKFIKEDGEDVEFVTITNQYDRYHLEIEKILSGYVEVEGGNSTFVFELTGFDDKGKSVYHKYVGMQFSANGGDSQKLPVYDIPRTVKVLQVKESYSGNFKPSKNPQTASFDEKTGTFSVSFENSPVGEPSHGSGAINKFKINDKDSYVFDSNQNSGAEE